LILLAFVFSTIAVLPLQSAEAQTTMKTYPIVDAIPNPVGVGQETLLKCGISEAAPSASYGWSGITMTVTKPDGHTETLGPFTTDSTGSTYTTYVPDQTGNYTITTNFPNNTYPITSAVSGRTAPYSKRHYTSSKLHINDTASSRIRRNTILPWSCLTN
jgi:hypothetical protein